MAANRPPRIKSEQNNSFAIALIQALSVTDPVQDLTAGNTDLDLATGLLRSLVRGNGDLSRPLSDLEQIVSNFSHRESIKCNQQDPAQFMEGLLELIQIENPGWFQDTCTGTAIPPPPPGSYLTKNHPSKTKKFSSLQGMLPT